MHDPQATIPGIANTLLQEHSIPGGHENYPKLSLSKEMVSLGMKIDDDGSGGGQHPVSEVLLVLYGEGGPGGGAGAQAPHGLHQAGQTSRQHD
ncbi:hypothetical protein E2C01_012442 [Portunus trituberculatus]|uniref:Uncharacterized protein n=1 Tax=Portunus trituberculatus TaxID=210409 RepID=A0A5B7DEK0_PORTR|nr:hypothetical protein [Portunus trituberculatus]